MFPGVIVTTPAQDKPYVTRFINDCGFTFYLDVEYDATPLEYEAGYYFGGGVEITSATISAWESLDTDDAPPAIYRIGGSFDLSKDEAKEVAKQVFDMLDRDHDYPRYYERGDW